MEKIDLKALRKSHNLTQRDLANELGVSTSFVGQIETGRSKLPDSLQEVILTKFGVGTKRDDDLNLVPLLPIYAKGGTLAEFAESVQRHECEQLISPVKDAELAITVSGDSMYPEYPNGSYVFLKQINDKAFIEWGRTFVLDTCNGSIIKKVFPGKEEGSVLCKSINPEYKEFEVKMEDIYGMYRVLLMMALK